MSKEFTTTHEGFGGDQYIAKVTPREQIVITGWKKTGEKVLPIDGKNEGEKLYLDAAENGGDAWLILADYCQENGIGTEYTIRSCRELAVGKQDRFSFDHVTRQIQTSKPIYRPISPKTFKVGDDAVYGSYNLIYTGEIISIGKKTVTIDDHGRRKRLKFEDFCWRNWDYNSEEIASKNFDTMQYI